MAIEPKPLTKDRRSEISRRSEYEEWSGQPYDSDPYDIIVELLAAEAFWREAVQNGPYEGEWGECNWCNEEIFKKLPHKPTCLWLLAQ